MRPDQVVLTLFTFEVLKQCDQMAVAIDNARFKMVARKHSRSFQNLQNSRMFSSVNDSQYTVIVQFLETF